MKNTILILLFFCFGVCKGQIHTIDLVDRSYTILGIDSAFNPLLDTIMVIAQISDTAAYEVSGYIFFETNIAKKDTVVRAYRHETEWWYLYSVREKHNTSEGVPDAGGVHCIDNYGNTIPCYSDYWKHLYYLDQNKQPLKKSIIVWQSMEVETKN